MQNAASRTPVDRLRATFASGKTLSLAWRKAQLQALERLLEEQEARIAAALAQDLGRSAFDTYVTDIALTKNDCRATRKNLERWLAPEKVRTPFITQPGRSWVVREPLGVVLVIAPWNYPVQLCLEPAMAALAAGNCVVLKPSEVSQHTAALLGELVPQYLDKDAVAVLQGGVPETTALLEQRFDHILYTGNGKVAEIVMRAAARHLTPVTLELGGKSPAIIDADVDLEVALRRITQAKLVNAGQTCVAVDYVLVHRSRYNAVVEGLHAQISAFYGDNPRASADFGRIVNARHVERLASLMQGGRIACGGEVDAPARYVAPTVLVEVDLESPLMHEEIFGPLLPVIPVDSLLDAIAFVKSRPKPLALYAFSRDQEVCKKICAETSSGAFVANDCATHAYGHELPFGGVGASGMGAYHGRFGIDTFSHKKAVLYRSSRFDLGVRYPPYSPDKLAWIRRLL